MVNWTSWLFYNHSQGFEVGITENKSSKLSGQDLNLGPQNYKSSALTNWPRCLQDFFNWNGMPLYHKIESTGPQQGAWNEQTPSKPFWFSLTYTKEHSSWLKKNSTHIWHNLLQNYLGLTLIFLSCVRVRVRVFSPSSQDALCSHESEITCFCYEIWHLWWPSLWCLQSKALDKGPAIYGKAIKPFKP